MENEKGKLPLVLSGNNYPNISYKPGEITFNDFDRYLAACKEVAEIVSETEVNESSVKTAKKIVAEAHKVADKLNEQRKAVKRELMAPVKAFEDQVKVLTTIIDDAERDVRIQIRALDEKERDEKKKAIKELWSKRIELYDVKHFDNAFESWLEPKHLNKSVSMKAVEDDMTAWLEKTQADLDVINLMDAKSEILPFYGTCFNLTASLASLEAKKQREKAAKEAEEAMNKEAKKRFFTVIEIYDANEALMAEKLLDDAGITYVYHVLEI